MNRNRFDLLMNSVDDSLLEEAQRPVKRPRAWLRAAGLAAACLAVTAGFVFLSGWPETTTVVNPVREATETELEQLGYSVPLPEDAQEPACFLIGSGDEEETPMAEIRFRKGENTYFCRALKCARPQDISGMYSEWTESLDWSVGELELQMRQSEEDTAWVGWYEPDAGIQWCLSGEENALSLLHTAQSILEQLGYDMTVAPEDAENVVYNAFELDGMAVGETTFSLRGVTYSYRIASTGETDENFADISGLEGSFGLEATASILYCPARVYYDEGEQGKIVWFDVVSGFLYSLRMDSGASEAALTEMAAQLFVPMQGEVG